MDKLTTKVVARLTGIPREECAEWRLEDIHSLVRANGMTGKVLYLLRPEHLPLLPNGTVLYSVTGEQVVKGQDPIDDDTRGGFLAYGFLFDY